MPEIDARDMGAGFGELKSLGQAGGQANGKGHKVVTGMRGSYGGVLMFGMLTSFAGLGMFNPLSLGAGLVLGRKAYKEDMENRMLRVRSEAKTNVRRFVDDVSFVVSKESRDRLKGVQRQLRDHYRDIANQTTRSLNESLQAALAAAKLEVDERNTRVRELERQLNILRQVTEHAVNLSPPTSPRNLSAQSLSWASDMSTSDHVRAILGGTIQAYRARPAYRERPDVHNELDWIGRRLNQPIRIALAGTLKAGKSTLVNALVGEDIAPTDATEATRIVTWFRNGPTPKVTANHRGGRRTNVPIARDPG